MAIIRARAMARVKARAMAVVRARAMARVKARAMAIIRARAIARVKAWAMARVSVRGVANIRPGQWLVQKRGYCPKPPKFEHIFVSAITFFSFLYCRYFWNKFFSYYVCFKMICKKSL